MNSRSLSSDSLKYLLVFGERIRLARIRRGWTGTELAERAGVSRNTVSALERGHPGTAIGVYLSVLWVLGLEKSFDGVADPDLDTHGKVLEAARRPKRARTDRRSDKYDF